MKISTIMNKEFLFWRGRGKRMTILLRDLEMGMGIEEVLRGTMRSVFSGWDIPGLLHSFWKRKTTHWMRLSNDVLLNNYLYKHCCVFFSYGEGCRICIETNILIYRCVSFGKYLFMLQLIFKRDTIVIIIVIMSILCCLANLRRKCM